MDEINATTMTGDPSSPEGVVGFSIRYGESYEYNGTTYGNPLEAGIYLEGDGKLIGECADYQQDVRWKTSQIPDILRDANLKLDGVKVFGHTDENLGDIIHNNLVKPNSEISNALREMCSAPLIG